MHSPARHSLHRQVQRVYVLLPSVCLARRAMDFGGLGRQGVGNDMVMKHERGECQNECQVRCATWRREYELAEIAEYRTFPRRARPAIAAQWSVA